MSDVDSLSVTVSEPKGDGNFGVYFRGEIEEDVFHKAILKEIKQGEKGGGKYPKVPAWVWIYELIGDDYKVETDDGEKNAQIIEKTSQKFTAGTRKSNAFKRYCELTGSEPAPGTNVSLKDLFGIKCKLMITNTDSGKETDDGAPIVYHNIEKVSIKGLENESKSSSKEETKKKTTKKKTKKVKKETVDESDEVDDDDDEDDLFGDL